MCSCLCCRYWVQPLPHVPLVVCHSRRPVLTHVHLASVHGVRVVRGRACVLLLHLALFKRPVHLSPRRGPMRLGQGYGLLLPFTGKFERRLEVTLSEGHLLAERGGRRCALQASSCHHGVVQAPAALVLWYICMRWHLTEYDRAARSVIIKEPAFVVTEDRRVVTT